ncbi:MAG: hypothetical protein ACR2HR_12780 [Euzebya sp.]
MATWARAGAALKEIRKAELLALTDEDVLIAAEDLLSALDRLPKRQPRRSSGLVEQQRLFQRARTR